MSRLPAPVVNAWWRTAMAAGVAVSMPVAACGTEPAAVSEPQPSAAEFVSSQVDASLGQLSRAATTRGFTQEGEDHRGFLVERGPHAIALPLRSGNCYLLVAAASEAVRELDVALYAGDGTEVARDDAAGRVAALHHCPPQSGTAYVSVQATAGNGLFALRVLRGPNGLDVRAEDIVRAAEPERPSR